MNKGFSEALAPLAARMPRAVRDIEILRVAAQLDGEDYEMAMDSARRGVLGWAKNRAGGPLPPEAWKLQEFDLPRGGRNSSAVRILNDDMDFWALRADPLCQDSCRLVSKVNDTMRRAEERTTGGIFRGAEGICDCEDASAAQHSVAAAVAGRGHIERDAFAVAG